MTKSHKCKYHGFKHSYTRCNACSHEYCGEGWTSCPRCTAPKFQADKTVSFVDVSNISEYGLTQKLSNSIRVF